MGNRVLFGVLALSIGVVALAGVLAFEALAPIEHNVGDEAGVQSVAVADLDGDGVLDLVALDTDDETVTAYLGVGDGTFRTGQLVGEADLPSAVAVADLTSPFIGGGDVDGIPDVIVGDEIGGLQIFIGRGDGTFDPPDQSFDDLETVEISGVAAADFDGDGRDDLALLESFDGVYFLCNEAGTLQSCPTSVVLLDEFSFELVDIDVGDFDGGGLDVTAVDLDAGLLFVIHGNGDGTFEEVVEPIEIGEVGIEPVALRVGRLDADDHDDIAVLSFDTSSNPLASTLSVFSGADASTPFERADFAVDGVASALVLRDIDGDDAADAVVVGAEEFGDAQYSGILRGNGTSFAAPVSAGLESISGGRMLESGDFDGDGKIDLVAAVEDGSRLQVLLNRSEASSGCVGDCNGDGAVAINELVRGVNIALGNADPSTCSAVDRDGNGAVAINELIAAVNSALGGCAG
jgi:hypothetical protein